MRVALTGGTGYVGAFAIQALLEAGHQPRLLVRDRAKLATKLGALGVDAAPLDVVVGDMTDRAAVEQLVAGCDAAIHAAASVEVLNRNDARRTIDTNVGGTRNVVEAALAAGCDPVVHVSSVAVFGTRPAAPVVTADLEPATASDNPYGRSKALAEQFARERQAAGDPVVIVYPGGVTGPGVAGSYGELAQGFVSMLKAGALVTGDGGFGVIDVRDLAAVFVAILEPGRGPRRFMAGGVPMRLPEVAAVIRQVTGRRFPVLPIPGAVFRGLGHVTDGLRRVVPFDTVFTAEAMETLTLARPTDDSAVHEELGVAYRDPVETIEASLRALHAGGALEARHVGVLATNPGSR
ncbi:MAG TPA: NAD-dependent epimerase/dehydratase family protein [Mycobacteriales bacterium]|nr:NAD-dependent epimerase/dehydratase family protein [Mycobacteriales bacterium]